MLALFREKSEQLGIKKDFLSRSLDEGFSGGEKKRNEIFQMMMLNPKLAILDETDSGLDIDALRVVADRKSTRLNSSHVKISYAVFCLKKKKKKRNGNRTLK